MPKPLKAAEVDALFHSSGRDEVVDVYLVTLLSKPVYATDSLFDFHRVPWDVVVHQAIAELIIQAFATHFGRK